MIELDKILERHESNAEYERTHGNLQDYYKLDSDYCPDCGAKM